MQIWSNATDILRNNEFNVNHVYPVLFHLGENLNKNLHLADPKPIGIHKTHTLQKAIRYLSSLPQILATPN